MTLGEIVEERMKVKKIPLGELQIRRTMMDGALKTKRMNGEKVQTKQMMVGVLKQKTNKVRQRTLGVNLMETVGTTLIKITTTPGGKRQIAKTMLDGAQEDGKINLHGVIPTE